MFLVKKTRLKRYQESDRTVITFFRRLKIKKVISKHEIIWWTLLDNKNRSFHWRPATKRKKPFKPLLSEKGKIQVKDLEIDDKDNFINIMLEVSQRIK